MTGIPSETPGERKRREKLRIFFNRLREHGGLCMASAEAGIGHNTLANWRKKYPILDVRISEAQAVARQRKIENIVDKLYRQGMDEGNVKASQVFLWREGELKNNRTITADVSVTHHVAELLTGPVRVDSVSADCIDVAAPAVALLSEVAG